MAAPRAIFAAAVVMWGNHVHASLGGLHFASWDMQQVCQPFDVFQPRTEQELVAFVGACAAAAEPMRVVGAGHSFSAIAMAATPTLTPTGAVLPAHLIRLDRLATVAVRSRKPGGALHSLVDVGAGIRLFDLNTALEGLGLALENLGATAEQSLGGATATGTHGTGNTGSLSTQIVGLRMVLANATVVVIDESSGDIFSAACVGLGVLGIVTQLTVRVVDMFRMRLDVIPFHLDDLLPLLPGLLVSYPRLQWYWTPYTQNATLVLRTVTSDAITPGGCWGPPVVAGNGTTCVDVSYKTLTDSPAHYSARVLYTEMEMFVPVAQLPAAIVDFRAFQAQVQPLHNPSVALFTGVRYVQSDSLWLSPQFGRDNAVISMIVLGTVNTTGSPSEFLLYSQGLEEICASTYSGRPHWGKQNYATSADLAAAYPETFAKFIALRKELDPQGLFLNDYTIQRLAIPS